MARDRWQALRLCKVNAASRLFWPPGLALLLKHGKIPFDVSAASSSASFSDSSSASSIAVRSNLNFYLRLMWP